LKITGAAERIDRSAGVNRVTGSDDQKGARPNGKRERSMWRNLTKTIRDLQRSMAAVGGAYRPDLHYMRGPGPKWHAKYGHLAPKPERSASSSASTLRNLAERRA
jgi:hypothetical protein